MRTPISCFNAMLISAGPAGPSRAARLRWLRLENQRGRARRVPGAARADPAPAGIFALHSSERGFPAPEIQMAAQPPAQGLHKKPPPRDDPCMEPNSKWKKRGRQLLTARAGLQSSCRHTKLGSQRPHPEADDELSTL